MVRARYASTIVLVRPDEDGGFEILLTRRPPEMKFLGGFYVFPGGAVHQSDYAPKVLERCRGLAGNEARKTLDNRHDPELAIGHWVAGIRELFEEAGILLCVTESGAEIDLNDRATQKRFEAKRKAIVRGGLDFGDFLKTEALYCDLSRMVYFFHRITPEFYPMRFDTRFYIAPLPLNQSPLLRSEEVTDSQWIKPPEALARADREDFPILPPTTTVLGDLARIPTWNQLCERFNLR
jgi:8-oxo-dGTP pyrophosphatase MutT (NUDIX family)